MAIHVTAALLASLLCYATPAQEKKPARPNAEPLYVRAVKEMERALHDHDKKRMVLPNYVDKSAKPTGTAWRQAVAKAAVALTLFKQATQIPACTFRTSEDSEQTGLRTKAMKLVELRKIVTAHGLQQAQKNPRGACATAFHVLQFGMHCAQDPTLMGIAMNLDAEVHGAQILEAALPQLAKTPDSRALATRLLKLLELHLAKRPSRADLADTTELELEWMLKAEFATDNTGNPATEAASKRAKEILRELLQPLRTDPPMANNDFEARFEKRIAEMKKITRAKKVDDVLENGSGETLAAVLVLLGPGIPAYVLEQMDQCDAALRRCQQNLQLIASRKGTPKSNAVEVYLLAIDEARRAFGVGDREMLNLPHKVKLEDHRDAFWVQCSETSATARALFEQATQIDTCQFDRLPARRNQLDDLSQILMQLRTLVFAHGVQHMHRNPGVAMSGAFCLLDHARQFRRVPSLQAVALANGAEQSGLQIIEQATMAAIANRDWVAMKRCTAKLEEQQKHHGTLAPFATMMQDAIMAELDASNFITSEVQRSKLRKTVAACLTPVATHGTKPVAEVLFEIRGKVTALQRAVRGKPSRQAKGADKATALTNELLLKKLTRLEGLIRHHEQLAEQISERLSQIPR